ncbi:hypothetical protein BCR41DRAFT_58551 [Lobosporangium transversale]|uniref:Uncharacterized protein n=1 Tax=Lobosporangium transversale TaxID=64571 RepID=A0A1Y2GMU4_9FUNG|nr:hypothetical protein BCR41DRAFT_58551 [Lobosporangium transversale]ORZ16008.1 hypothetical protein BCR41DRAFT_58551 [Lobosporangium transversale]|eukprot:XP_021881355.1 hypothetical protein BCR41DRAFT_58551 [Lobosporangium transversale]
MAVRQVKSFFRFFFFLINLSSDIAASLIKRSGFINFFHIGFPFILPHPLVKIQFFFLLSPRQNSRTCSFRTSPFLPPLGMAVSPCISIPALLPLISSLATSFFFHPLPPSTPSPSSNYPTENKQANNTLFKPWSLKPCVRSF